MSGATIRYNNSTIASVNVGDHAELATKNKYLTDNIIVEADLPTGTKQISITENGTTIENVSGYASAEITVDTGEAIPAYLGHYTYTPETNVISVSIPIGTGAQQQVSIISNYRYATETANVVVSGVVALTTNSGVATASRLVVHKTGSSVSYYNSNSSGGQSWSFSNGVLTIANETGWVFKAGVRYDFFWRV